MILLSCLHSALLEVCASLQRLWAVFTHAGNSSHLTLITKPKDFLIILFNTERISVSSHNKRWLETLTAPQGKTSSVLGPWSAQGKAECLWGWSYLGMAVECSAHSTWHKFIWNYNIDHWRALEISRWLFSALLKIQVFVLLFKPMAALCFLV